MSNDWKPWQEFASEVEPLPIFEPPCAHCMQWNPTRVFADTGSKVIYAGVRMCTTPAEQMRDFSCFQAGEEK